jgi:UDP-N-acetylmuramate: L-alanyl-gamma-D-glutamyl-meso-diaminopimelate ligase
MVGSIIDGFDTMVGLSDSSDYAVLEGDEYLTSALDPRPKFHLYHPDIAILNGIAWDHMNVFPTFEGYVDQFRIFADNITPGGTLIWYDDDPEVRKIAQEARKDIISKPYKVHGYFQNKTGFYAATVNRVIPVKVFGEHNMQNLSAAREACFSAGVSEDDFYDAIMSFSGTSKRLQKLAGNENADVYLDFAHSPSKVKATVEAIAARYPGRDIVAILELHTYSSLSSRFLPLYKNTLNLATHSFVYFNPHALQLKKLPPITENEIIEAFGKNDIRICNHSSEMFSFISKQKYRRPVYLFMSSGDFDGTDLGKLANDLIKTI